MDEQSRLLSFDGKAAAKKVLDSWAYILLAFVLLLSILIGYLDVNFSPQIAFNLGVEYVLLLIFCAVGRYCLDNIAQKNGALSPLYIDAVKRSDAVRDRVKCIKGATLQQFCEDYRLEELEAVRKQMLSEAMLDPDDFSYFCENKKPPKGLTRKQRLALKRAKRLKPIRLNRYVLGRPITARGERMDFTTPQQELKRRTIPDFMMTVFTVLFPVSISFSLIMEPSLATLIAALLKTFTVVMASVKGYSARIKNMTEAVPAFVAQQEDLLAAFDAWEERGAVKNSDPKVTDAEFAALQARHTPSVDVI